jgi:hypothetical protein
MKRTQAQILLRIHLREMGYHDLEIFDEYQFWPQRKWRFDVAIPHQRLAFECSGGNWAGGHRRGKAQEDEYDKLNTATMSGWRVLQWTNGQILNGHAKEFFLALPEARQA